MRTLKKTEYANNNREQLEKSICCTCLNVDDCCYAADCTSPIYECEEFITELPKKENVFSKPATWIIDFPKSVKQNNLKGLCVNCVHAEDCSLPKDEAGVWYCEEYE